jgi:hypothetical protein
MDKTFKDLATRLGKPGPKAGQVPNFTIEDAAEFSIDVASGWVHTLTHTRTTKADRNLQEDTLTIKRK